MYLVDTNVISEARKKSKSNKGVRAFFKQAIDDETRLFISVVTVGELRRGVELIRHRGDLRQANQLEKWLEALLVEYKGSRKNNFTLLCADPSRLPALLVV